MNEESKVQVITLKELWDIFAHRWWLIIGVAVLCVIAAYEIEQLTFEPEYSSTATLYILDKTAMTLRQMLILTLTLL